MTEFSFFPLPFLLVVSLLALMLYRKRSWPLWRKLALAGFWAYLMVLVAVLYFPLRLAEDWPHSISIKNAMRYFKYSTNFMPFYFGKVHIYTSLGIVERPFPWDDILKNILMTIAFGAGLKLLT